METLHFKIGLVGTHWGKLPEWSICIDQKEIVTGSADQELNYIEFDHAVEDGSHQLSIQLTNKLDSDVQKDSYDDPENFTIINDMLLHIKSIEVDEIDLTNVAWNKSQFVPEDSAKPILKNCVDLGWNGEWQLEFDSPFYLWLLENI